MRVTPETLEEFLGQHGVSLVVHEHQALFSAKDVEHLTIELLGADTKNLFLVDEGSGQLYLVVVPLLARVALKELARSLGVKRFSFASAEVLGSTLGVSPGSVTVLGVLNDVDRRVMVIIDEGIWSAPTVLVHPLRNTATVELSHDDLAKILTISGHEPLVMVLPKVA